VKIVLYDSHQGELVEYFIEHLREISRNIVVLSAISY